MELYVQVAFWIGVIGIVFRLVSMIFLKYPTKIETTFGEETAYLFISIGFVFLAGRLLSFW